MRKLYDKCVPHSLRYAVWIFWPIVLGGWLSHAAFQNLAAEPNSLAYTMLVVGPALIIGRTVEASVWGLRRYLSTGPRARAARAAHEEQLKAEAAEKAAGESVPGP